MVYDERGQKLEKPGQRFVSGIPLEIRQGPRFVGRGGEKLDAAIRAFGLNVSGAVAADVGASTGGFTDCLLQHGAARVYAIDVGYGQLAWELRQDPRVIVMERTNIRGVTPADFPEQMTFFAADCSFISLRLVLPPVLPLLAPRAHGIVLIKPQFEAGRQEVGKGGVVREAAVHERVVAEVLEEARSLGFESGAMVPSPLLGPAGNKEFLALLRAPAGAES